MKTYFEFIGVSLWRQLPKNSLKISHNRIFTSSSVLTFVDKYQDGIRCTNYSQRDTDFSQRDTHSDPNLVGLSRKPLYILHYLRPAFQSVGKKNFNVHSTHYTQFKTSTSAGIIFETIWLILIGSICFHMSQNI